MDKMAMPTILPVTEPVKKMNGAAHQRCGDGVEVVRGEQALKQLLNFKYHENINVLNLLCKKQNGWFKRR